MTELAFVSLSSLKKSQPLVTRRDKPKECFHHDSSSNLFPLIVFPACVDLQIALNHVNGKKRADMVHLERRCKMKKRGGSLCPHPVNPVVVRFIFHYSCAFIVDIVKIDSSDTNMAVAAAYR